MQDQTLNQAVTGQGVQQSQLVTHENNRRLDSPFMSIAAFETGQRMAKALASSDLVPQQFRNNVGNTLLALEMANRLEMPVFSVLQSIYIVHGKPSFSAAFLIAVVNSSNRFDTPILFKFNDARTECYAYAKKGGEEIRGTTATIEMAKLEGWYSKKGSKWQTMPELMLQYRAATFFARTYAPDLMMGVKSSEELQDAIDTEVFDKEPKNDLNGIVTKESEVTKEGDKLDKLKQDARDLGIKFRSDITYPTLFKKVGERIAELDEEETAGGESVNDGENNNGVGDMVIEGDVIESNTTASSVSTAYPRLIQLGVKRTDLNDFCNVLNLNAANINEFMSDIAGVESQVEQYYNLKGE